MLGRPKRKQDRNTTAYLLILPAFSVVFVIAAYSAYWLFRMSLVNWTFGEQWSKAIGVGIDNYRWLLFSKQSTFWTAVKTSMIYVGTCLAVELILGLSVAVLLNENIMGRSIYTAALIIPIVLMPAMVGMIFRLYFSFDGLVNFFIQTFFGTKLNWLGVKLALPAVILVDIWEATPFFILIFLAGLQALPKDPYEAALVDGASGWQTFRFVTLPMMAPLILTGAILRLMDLLRGFDVIFAMVGGGPGDATTTLPLYIYKMTLIARNVGRGSAASILLICMIGSITYILIRIFQRVRFYN